MLIVRPPTVVDLANGGSRRLASAPTTTLSGWSWSPEGTSLMNCCTGETGTAVATFDPRTGANSRVGAGGIRNAFPAEELVRACYASGDHVAVGLSNGVPTIGIARLIDEELLPTPSTVQLGRSAGFMTILGRAQGSDHVVATVLEDQESRSRPVMYSIRLSDLHVMPILNAEQLRGALPSHGGTDGLTDQIGEWSPATGGGWAFPMVRLRDHDTALLRVSLDSGQIEVLAKRRLDWPIDVNSDGTRIAFSEPSLGGEGRSISIADVEMATVVRLTSGDHEDDMPMWNESRDEIVFVRDHTQIWRVSVDGGKPMPVCEVM